MFFYQAKTAEEMVEYQLKAQNITDKLVLNSMLKVPRDQFVPKKLKDKAYLDSALPIKQGQTISQPYIVALMLQMLNLKKKDYVLDIGTGSGYAAAVLANIVKKVYSIERDPYLAKQAKIKFTTLKYDNIEVKIADGTKGWAEKAPFPAILVSAATVNIPKPLLKQLDCKGTMVIPIGEEGEIQQLTKITKNEQGEIKIEKSAKVRFVPLVKD